MPRRTSTPSTAAKKLWCESRTVVFIEGRLPRTARNQPRLFDVVASNSTGWRTLEAIDATVLARIAVARAHARENAWLRGMDPGFYVIDLDATLVAAHSEKEQAAPTYKRGFGFHPLVAYLDAHRRSPRRPVAAGQRRIRHRC